MPASTTTPVPTSTESVHAQVREYYGAVLESSGDLQTNACCAGAEPARWLKQLLANVHDDVLGRFYGCGYPIPESVEGCTVVDLGCGSGRDVYLLSQLVGPGGQVHGVDMTEGQLAVARATEGWHRDRFGHPHSNVCFHLGTLERLDELPLPSGSVDVVVSNCVVNLSPEKERVLEHVYRILKPGGEFFLSDVLADRRLPEEIVRDPVLYGECLGGASYRQDFEDMARRVGFRDPRWTVESPIQIESPEVLAKVGAARFTSVTYRLLKVADLDTQCEDYGQVATYQGGIPHHDAVFWLDDHHAFERGRPERVCRNTAAMLSQTRFAPWFSVTEPTQHFGAYPCGPTMAAAERGTNSDGQGSAACC